LYVTDKNGLSLEGGGVDWRLLNGKISYNRNHAKEINTVRGKNSVFEGIRLAIYMILTLSFKGLVYKNAKLKYFLIKMPN
jgi:hypothetical protein